MKRLLWFSHFIPYPPKGGAHQRSFNLLRHASRSYEVALVAFNLLGQSPERLAGWRNELKKYCADVEFWEMPIRWKSARWWARLVTSPFDRAPYGCRSFWSPELDLRWRATLRRNEGALVHFDSIDLALFAGAAPGFRKVLNHHNCESAMAERRAAKEHNLLKKVYLQSQARKLARLESAICPAFNVNLAVSRTDLEALQSRSPEAHFHTVENGTDTEYFAPLASEEVPNSVIFAASLNWYPNISAVRFFVEQVWPLVKERHPGAQFYVAGMAPAEALLRWLEQDSSIVVISDPEDIRPWIARAAVFVCPMLDGGGTKLKILDAMAMRKPVVSTSVGCEGLEVKNGESILIGDAARDLAKMISLALESRLLSERMGAAAQALIEKRYSWEIIGRSLKEAYRCGLNSEECAGRLASTGLRAR
jgi:polysaccharide biosynthesis protein PslH